jgi:hypothetical protein
MGLLRKLVRFVKDLKSVWCFFMHIEHHFNDESIMRHGEEITWCCSKCKRGWSTEVGKTPSAPPSADHLPRGAGKAKGRCGHER